MTKKKVAVIFGGTNTEHEVSIVSARSIISNLDQKKYQAIPIKITKDNQWIHLPELSSGKSSKTSPQKIKSSSQEKNLTTKKTELPTLGNVNKDQIDIVFPVIHGPYGEDGTLQGMMEMAGIPYVGCGVLGSAVCMDKVIQKQICQNYNIPMANYIWFTKHNWKQQEKSLIKDIEKKLKYPCFVKPANQGSSVGVTKAHNQKELKQGIDEALKLDLKVIIEQAIPNVREIECSVMGNNEPEASVLGEIVASNEFYDYDAKYIDGKSQAYIPAKLGKRISNQIQNVALEAFKVLNCSGLARVDFLYDDVTKKFYLNELNTMPGFTTISMYPKLWEASGVSYKKLLDKLIQLGLERYNQKQSINYSYTPKTNWHQE